MHEKKRRKRSESFKLEQRKGQSHKRKKKYGNLEKVSTNLCEKANRSNSNRKTHEAWAGGERVINIRQGNAERKGRDGGYNKRRAEEGR